MSTDTNLVEQFGNWLAENGSPEAIDRWNAAHAALACRIEELEREHQDFRLQNDREWKEKVDYQKARADAAPLVKRPVAFRLVDPTDGVALLFQDEELAQTHAERMGVDYQGLYVRDGGPAPSVQPVVKGLRDALDAIRLEARQREELPLPSALKDTQRGTALALAARLAGIERSAKAALSALTPTPVPADVEKAVREAALGIYYSQGRVHRKDDGSIIPFDEIDALERICIRNDARAALLAAAPFLAPVREGWRLVPEEPTEAMIEKGRWGGLPLDDQRRVNIAGIYRAMLAAAPTDGGRADGNR